MYGVLVMSVLSAACAQGCAGHWHLANDLHYNVCYCGRYEWGPYLLYHGCS